MFDFFSLVSNLLNFNVVSFNFLVDSLPCICWLTSNLDEYHTIYFLFLTFCFNDLFILFLGTSSYSSISQASIRAVYKATIKQLP